MDLKEIVNDKANLIQQKKEQQKFCGSIDWGFAKSHAQKQVGDSNAEELEVEVVANMAMFMDHDNDVLLSSSWSKSVSERATMIPFLHDHRPSAEARIGTTKGFETRPIDLTPFGFPGKTGEALVHKALVRKSYNDKIFNQYMQGDIKQHSIGLRYVQIDLAANDPDFEDEFKNWNKYINQLINPEKANEKGYFWVVKEIKLIENSAVLFGSNELTPTLGVQPPGDTGTDGKNEPGFEESFFKTLKSVS